ncbi:MAG: ParB/RepB/Spo0J family partition protein [Chloroflexi bacterium]|nr:MAG: ParB/RepB/Spo0J family partition protein [Chloroflexota bacterium]MBL1195316.1 ParB/RepB/Spo0J family partition protein [Chloroflexota bacterium]NOH12600.1 ParB/RepB/Spo0J family partition protein [Chloroflexota bacterium]
MGGRKRSGLGKGLDALIPPSESQLPKSGVQQIPVKAIKPNPRQPRTNFDEGELSELAASIREHGVIQPLIVTQGSKPDGYTLIAGERRWQAAQLAELEQVPAILREASDQQLLELALIENVQRADLSPLEAAEAYQHLSDEFKLSHDDIAQRVGKSRVAITNTLGLLDLSKKVKEALADGRISEGHGRALKALTKAQAQNGALETVLNLGLNVRQTEELVRKRKGKRSTKAPKTTVPAAIRDLEERLRDSLGTKVRLKHGAKGGNIAIHYYSDEELDALVERLTNEK